MTVRADMRRTIGDDWEWTWTTADDVSGWDNPVVSIRRSHDQDADLLATTTGVSPSITTTGTNFADGVLAWQVPRATTVALGPGPAWLEVEVLVNGKALTVMSEPMVLVDEVAVR